MSSLFNQMRAARKLEGEHSTDLQRKEWVDDAADATKLVVNSSAPRQLCRVALAT